MRRSGPPKRKTPLDRRAELQPGQPPERRTRLRPRSAKMRDRYERAGGRRDLVARLLAERPWCEAKLTGICTGRATDVHERVNRSGGGDILDEAILLTVCRACHAWITEHPRDAERLGLRIWSWDSKRPR